MNLHTRAGHASAAAGRNHAAVTGLGIGLYVRLSGFYLVYFAILGVLLPYWGLYLLALGFDPARIGELMAIPQATKLVAPTLWGWLADRSGQRLRIVRGACLAAVVLFAGVYAVGGSYAGLMLVMLGFSFFWNAALPQFEVITLNHLGAEIHRYSRVRLWGSVGFIVAAVGVGFLVERWGVGLVPAADVEKLLPRESAAGMTAEVVYQGPVKAPIAKGDAVAELVVHIPGLPDARIPLVAETDVGTAGPLQRLTTAVSPPCIGVR